MLPSSSSFLNIKQHSSSYSSFDFNLLDKRLNKQKIQQQKQKSIQQQTLQIYQKPQPNQQLIEYCDKVMRNYRDHYNTNRTYSICDLKRNNNGKIMNQQNQTQKDLINITKYKNLKSTLISTGTNVLKPFKPLPVIPKTHHKISTQLFNNDQFLPPLKQNNKPSQKKHFSNIVLPFDHKKQLQYKFRKNIWIIIQKLTQFKLTFSEIIHKDIFSKQPYKFGTEIFNAVKQGNQPKVFRIIIQNKLSLFSVDTTYKTPLIWACIRGHNKIAELLIYRGVDPEKKDMNGQRSLDYAVKYNHAKCVKVILLNSKYANLQIDRKQMSKQIRKIFRVYTNSFKILGKLTYEKRVLYFEQQYKYDLYD